MPEEPEGPAPEEPEHLFGDDFLNEEAPNFERPPAFFPYVGRHGRSQELGPFVEVDVEGVFTAEAEGQPTSLYVLLNSKDRRLPIVIGPYEAQAISMPLDNAQPDRPMSHDLMRNIIDRLDSSVERVAIDDLWNGVYYAKLYLASDHGDLEVDARPSDAIALAIRFGAPVFVAEGLLELELDG